MSHWTTADIPPQNGKLAIVTGTGGLGYETALALAAKGAEVILAGRNAAKGAQSISRIRGLHGAARIRFEVLDLASLASVAAFAERMASTGAALDILINNAGVMMLPTRQATADGFEMQIGTNYFGHFSLTGHLLPLLRKTAAPRVVNLASLAHRNGAIHFDDLNWQKTYKPWAAYEQSKLAMLIFALELQRQSDAHGWGLMSNAAHPGFARTELIANGPGTGTWLSRLSALLRPFLSQDAAAGALPTLFAAVSPEAKPAGYYGPDGFYEMKGSPKPAFIAKQALDTGTGRRLWQVSQDLTGVRFGEPAEAA